MKYTPLDLSFIKTRYSPEQESIRNTAAMIMANAGWGNELTFKEMKAVAKAQKEAKAQHKQGALAGFFDLLSTPLYGVANALDEALAGHQSDNNDSVLEDVAKTAGGVLTGFPKGLGAGLRGSTSLIDALPGVDIDDEWQSDPTDKTYMGDVMLRKTVGMSTADALKPENYEKVKALLEESKNKPSYEKSLGQLALEPLIPDLDDPELQQKFAMRMKLGSIPFDIALDPLNAVGLPIKGAKVSNDVIEGLEAARANEGTSGAIIEGLKSKNLNTKSLKTDEGFIYKPPIATIDEAANPSAAAPETAASIETGPPIAALDEIEDPATAVIKSIGAFPSGSKPGFIDDPLKVLQREESVPQKGFEVGGADQVKIVKRIIAAATSGDKNWSYKAADILREYPTVTWTKTEEILQRANAAIKKLGVRGANGLAPALRARISEDVGAVRAAKPAPVQRRRGNEASLIDNLPTSSVQSEIKNGKLILKPGSPKLRASEAKLANRIVRKFESEILHTGRAPGTGEGLARAIASGDNVRYSGPQQARMWNDITTALKYADARKFDKAVRILRAVEDYYMSKGVIPHSSVQTKASKKWGPASVPLRLSQVAEAIGPQTLQKSHAFITGILRGDAKALAQLTDEQIQAIEALKTSEAIASAPAVQKGVTEGKRAIEEILKAPLSAGRKKPLLNDAIKEAKLTTASFGGGDTGAKVAGEYLGSLVGKTDAVESALKTQRFQTEAWLSTTAKGSKFTKPANSVANDADFLKAVTNAICKASDLPNPAQLGGVVGATAHVKEWLGARFNAAYGVQDMRQIYLVQHSSAMNIAARRAKLLNDFGRRFDPKDADLWHEAFRTAQANGIASGRVAELHAEIAKVMENLVGGSGLRSGAIADSTVVGRSRLLVDELNANLKRFGLSQFKFETGKNVKDAAGNVHDFSQGADWMKSWEAWDVKNPYEFLHKFQTVIQHTVHEKVMFDEIAMRFGSIAKKGNVKYGVNHPRLNGFFFTEEGARQAKVFVRMLEEVSTPNSKVMQHLDHVLSKMKAAMTIYIPGHHFTNIIGDTYYNWIAGVNKPVRYEQAMKTMLAQKGRYGDFASFNQLTSPEAMKQAVARSLVKPDAGLSIPAAGNKTIVTMQNGTRVTADMIYTAAMREGILPSAKVLEEVGSDVTSILDKIHLPGKAKGSVQRSVHQVSEIRDHVPRLAQFIDGIAKSKGDFGAAVTSSARNVRKWHPDGLDLTKFERNVMKRVFPFYSWTRKAIPLAIEASLFAAPKVMAYPRLMEAIALSNGIHGQDGVRDPFPTDQMFPDWIRDRGIGPIMGGPGNYLVANPSTPVLDMITLMGEPKKGALGMLNPMAKVPLETMMDREITGAPIESWSDYGVKQIPVVSHLGRASGQIGVSETTKADDSGKPELLALINSLFGAKAYDTGRYQKSAQFDLRDYFKEKSQQQFK